MPHDTLNSAPSPTYHPLPGCGHHWHLLISGHCSAMRSQKVTVGWGQALHSSQPGGLHLTAASSTPKSPLTCTTAHMAALTLSRSREGLGDGQTARSGLCVVTHPTPLLILWILTHQLALTCLQAVKVTPGPDHYSLQQIQN